MNVIEMKPTSYKSVPTTNLLLELFLKYDFWRDHNHMISKDYFEMESRKIYETICFAHEKFEHDLTIPEVEALILSNNPLLTAANRASILDITRNMSGSISPDIAKEVLKSAFREYVGQTIAELGMSLMNGEVQDLTEIQNLVERYQDGFQPDEVLVEVSMEYDDIFNEDEDDFPWKWNLTALDKLVPGIGPGTLTTVFALVETGKSAFVVSTSFGPGSFLDQGAKVLMICNEEPAKQTVKRAAMSHCGLNLAKAFQNREYGKRVWNRVKGRAIVRDALEYPTLNSVETLVRKFKPDVLIIDQLDKMEVSGTFARDDLRLSEVYRKARFMAKKHQMAVIAVSQADASADGRTSLRFTQMANSKIGKAAEADVIIGIGKEQTDTNEDNFLRYLHVSKNKLGGRHGRAIVRIEPEVSRYLD
jgi:replicative DNA helicase